MTWWSNNLFRVNDLAVKKNFNQQQLGCQAVSQLEEATKPAILQPKTKDLEQTNGMVFSTNKT